ncbi:glycoside hydrolase family 3 C-terminal domain-containing protein [Neobacillus drentensis]|uniref:glycoside hydrolase family 3 C-terminal domain-containing protein n=1 Tax=Neobacillus drentensis TaxID=220684 RepID=UPI001F26EB4E|nr:glycoside hydrolase family 3 C-terminal domain-containing protein [Neobacillus drentensis]ULT57631.1 glycoside hydrolase family 3 C-terminal domain-containing protein [Neobacillus drentensis]
MNKTLLFRDETQPFEDRINNLIEELTLDEKISLLSTSGSAIPRLGIEEYHIGGEAAHGVVDRSGGKTTVFPQPIGLSSTWNKELLRRIGDAIGDEARVFYQLNDRKHGLTLWAPTIDMERDPRWGRTEEAYGEDPYLTGKLSTELIRGMQGDHPFYVKMAAAPKHFYGNNNEYGRGHISNSIDPRNRNEYYLKAFEPAFKEGHALSLMTAYNGVNGIPCMQIHEIRNVLKDEWGMDGYVVSDGGALTLNVTEYHYYDTPAEALADALKKGIDCFVDDKELVEKSAYEALENNWISEQDITAAIRNILRVRFRLGHFDQDVSLNPYHEIPVEKMCSEEHDDLAFEATKESIVLLKNDHVLPLDEKKIHKIAVIGPNADEVYKDWYTGYAQQLVTPLQGIINRLKDKEVVFVKGNDEIALKSIKENAYLSVNDENRVVASSSTIGQNEVFELEEWGWGSNVLKSVAQQKYIRKAEKGAYFSADKKEVFDWFIREKVSFTPFNQGTHYHLSAWEGEPLAVSETKELIASSKAEEFEKVVISSGIDRAVEAARQSDAAVVVVGNHPMLNGRETEDRPDIVLPEHQEKLIQEVFKANPNTIVVIVGSYPFAVNWANDHIPAILYTSHGSQRLGDGIAAILFGDEAPSGRLSMTWYKDVSQLPSIFDYDIIKGNRTYLYTEGEVLYPFGHGLSYVQFNYSGLEADTDTLSQVNSITLSFKIENYSDIEASEVVQLYATIKDSSVKRPLKQLVDFEKIKLKPGETRKLSLTVKPEQLSFWDVSQESYCLENGQCILSVGSSSQDIRLSTEIRINGETVPPRNLTQVTKAENYDDYENVFLNKGDHNWNCVTNKANGWICFKNVDLGAGSRQLEIHAATEGGAGTISVVLDEVNGKSLANLRVDSHYPFEWLDVEAQLEEVKGIHDVYVKFEGPISLNSLKMV